MTNYNLVIKPAFTIVGIECKTSNDPHAAPQDIPKLWQKFFTENVMSKIQNKVSEEVFALYCDYQGDYTKPYSLVIGCAVHNTNNIPAGMVAKTVPGGSYAVFNAKGEHPKTLVDTWGKIWKSDIKRTYTGDYELYTYKFNFSPQEIDVFVAVK
jgi:predicted transcriptional regulator YdeE